MEENLYIEDGKKPDHTRITSIIVIAVCLVILLCAAAWLALRLYRQPPQQTQQVSQTQQASSTLQIPSDLTGTLVFSAAVLSTTTDMSTLLPPLMLYAPNGQISLLPLSKSVQGNSFATVQYSASNDNGWITFLGIPVSHRGDMNQPFSVYRADLSNTESDSNAIAKTLQMAPAIASPSSDDHFREAPVVSASGTVLYASLSQKQFSAASSTYGSLPAEDWTIYEVDSNGKKTKVTNGLRPKWVDSSHFAFLKNDGAYYYDLTAGKETKILPLSDTPNLATGLDVSSDGRFMALSDPAAQSVTVVQIHNWALGQFTLYATIPTVATYPTFSPNNNYLAMLVLYQDPNNASSSIPSLRYYDLATKSLIVPQYPFNFQKLSGLFLTDWIR